jgi:nucleotide-binding universal stress UspA family protein
MIPPRVVLAPVDFSAPSRTALHFASRLARQAGAVLHVVHAQDPLLAEGARQAGLDLARETEEELGRFLTGALPAPGPPPHLHVATGSAVDVIVDVARRCAADVVVVGSHGMSGAERLVFGSTTEGLLRRAPLPILVTPAEWSPASPTTQDLSGTGPVIAAVDFSAAAVEAAKAACRLAATLHTTLDIVHVVSEPPVHLRWRMHAETAVRERAAAARTQLDAVAALVACTVPVQLRLETGAVPSRLADAAALSGSRRPILVLGRREPGERGGPPGSTAYRVLTQAKVPMLLYVREEA